MHVFIALVAIFIAYHTGVSIGKDSKPDVVVEHLPPNFFSEKTVATKYCTDKWGNTIVSSRTISGRTTVTE